MAAVHQKRAYQKSSNAWIFPEEMDSFNVPLKRRLSATGLVLRFLAEAQSEQSTFSKPLKRSAPSAPLRGRLLFLFRCLDIFIRGGRIQLAMQIQKLCVLYEGWNPFCIFIRLAFDKPTALLYLMRFPTLGRRLSLHPFVFSKVEKKISKHWKHPLWRAGSSVGRAFDF